MHIPSVGCPGLHDRQIIDETFTFYCAECPHPHTATAYKDKLVQVLAKHPEGKALVNADDYVYYAKALYVGSMHGLEVALYMLDDT